MSVDPDQLRRLDPDQLDRLAEEFAPPHDRPRRLLESLRRRPLLGEEEIRVAVYGATKPAAALTMFHHDLLNLHKAYARLLLDRLAEEFAPHDRPRRLLEALRQRPLQSDENIGIAVYGETKPASATLQHDLLKLHAAYARLVRPPDDGLEVHRRFYDRLQSKVGIDKVLGAVQAASWEKADEYRGVAVAKAARDKVPFDDLAVKIGVKPSELAALLARMKRLPIRNRGGAER